MYSPSASEEAEDIEGINDQAQKNKEEATDTLVTKILMGTFAISLEGKYDIETNLTAAITCVSNVGPGFGAVGPAGGFSGYGWWAKLVSSVLMLAGRLELFPILILFDTSLWKKS